MTKQPTTASDSAASDLSVGAGAPEISSDVLEAGTQAFRAIEWEWFEQRSDEETIELVRSIYAAMRSKELAR